MKRVLALCLILAVAVIAGCGSKEDSGGRTEIEVAVFQGGFGLEFFQQAAREYEKLHPDVKIKLWGNPRVWEQLRPRFVSGDVPDLTWPGWGMDYWALVADGQVLAMDKYLAEKAYDQDIPWKDTFYPSLLNKGMYNGHYYIMPYNNNVVGWWYNVDMFKKHGWTPPKKYEELLVLCEKIKKAGIAPITYQGKYPAYMLRGFFFPWVISAGGIQVYNDAQNLKPGAWKHPAFLKAAQMIVELRDKGYFQKGAMGMDHTGSQMEFVLGRAAMITCGTWLGSEMKKQMPPDFHMAFFNYPMLKDGKGDPTLVSAGTEDWIIPAKAKHPDIAADFFRFMTSLEMAKKYVVEKNTLMSIKGSEKTDISPDLAGAAEAFNKASGTWDVDYGQWYKSLNKATESAIASLLNGEITPEQCLDRMEKAAEATRKDKSIPKHTVQ